MMDYEQIKEIVSSDAFIPVREFIFEMHGPRASQDPTHLRSPEF
jgi:hypothetical protein